MNNNNNCLMHSGQDNRGKTLHKSRRRCRCPNAVLLTRCRRESGIEAAELPGPIYQTANQGLERLTEFCHISALVWSQ